MQKERPVGWTVSTLNAVDDELEALADDMQARFVRIAELISEIGPGQVGAAKVKHLDGPIWEIRMWGRDGISRALCHVSRELKRVVVVRVFVKKTQKTPQREIRLARNRAKEFDSQSED